MTLPLKRFTIFILALLSFYNTQAQKTDSICSNFQTPPADTKPWVYWYWISDHISKDGITKDLEAMAKVGIGEALIGNIDEIAQKGNVKALTEDWWQMIEHAIREGKRTGVNIGLFNSPGWSQSGGPWVKPTQAMRYLTKSELRVKGPLHFNQKIAAPCQPFQDVALLAFPTPLKDQETISSSLSNVSTQPQMDIKTWLDGSADVDCFLPVTDTFVVDLETTSYYTARSLTLIPANKGFKLKCDLQIGLQNGSFKTIKSFSIDRSKVDTSVGFIPFGAISETFPSVTGKKFRIVFSKFSGKPGFSEISLSGAARAERYVEKQLGKLCPNPSPKWDTYMWDKPAEAGESALQISTSKILNISSKLSADGTLEWDVPAGEWIIQRIGMTPTGVMNRPASVEATGLEVDKMNRAWVNDHFDSYIGQIIKRMPAADRTALKHVVADSYETGAQNWTDGFATDFKKRYGYDPISWLPVLSGRVVESADLSDRFLWDLRRLIADRISYDYVGALRDVSNKYGLKLWLENYGHWGYPGEFLQYGGQSDEVSGEFWTRNEPEGSELRAASSSAHTYGKNVVHAEAFTSGGPMWNFEPWGLKKRGDWAATKGINHFILHVYIHQPDADKIPGINAWFGVEFNRHNTWFYQSKEWIDYLRRTHYLLQQGKYVADVAYFTGEDAPKMTGIRNPELPEGYNFDYINAEVIEDRLQVKDGRFVLPDGMSYRVLVLPPQSTMRPAVIQKLKQLIAAGGIVVGTVPTRSPSMENYPACDLEVNKIAQEIWQGCDGVIKTKVAFGAGTIYSGVSLTSVFSELKLIPDLGPIDAKRFSWIHRSTGDMDIYYISNQTDETVQISPKFRVTARQPELWDPITLEQRDLPDFKLESDGTILPLELAPRQSYFLVFKKKINESSKNTVNFPRCKTIHELEGSWNVSFDSKWGGPESVVFDTLQDWTTRPEPGIKYYSGTSRYLKKFNVSTIPKGKSIYLNLGKLNNLATLRLNGKSLGLLWAEPYQVDITQAVKKKNNVLEIEVTNTWNNRLVGDAALPVEKRLTSATTAPAAKAPLLPAGLLGPVILQIKE